jgi:anti-anti-sigma regulatory factor/anti-sigma regulatory factor (Ser/Thr protein kinase)
MSLREPYTYVRTVYYTDKTSAIRFVGRVNSRAIKDFSSALERYINSGNSKLTLDFSIVTHAYPNDMIAIISSIESLKALGHRIAVRLPIQFDTRKLFRSVNWAHLLSPTDYPASESIHERHLVARQFQDSTEQTDAVNDFMDVVLRNMEVPKDILSGLEWSINEITDNVLNHSNSKVGGFVQASTYPQEGIIAFAVADSGRGILHSLREGIPSLRTDLEAIGEAIKSGVTRNKEFGQGNGLAGSLKITTMSGGSFEVVSGKGRMYTDSGQTIKHTRRYRYDGTVISGSIAMDKSFSISQALDFGQSHPYVALNIIDLQYEMHDQDCLLLEMRLETTGFGSRRSGKQMHTKVMNFVESKPAYPIVIDWSGVPVISSSFADEFMGKLFLSLGAMAFSSKIRNRSMESLISGLLDKAISQRLTQALDEGDNSIA